MFRRRLEAPARAAQQRAMAYVSARHPAWSVGSAQLRADEPARYVFAVFYDEGPFPCVPGRYQLVAVSREEDVVEELETSPVSPYWIRGLK